MMSWIYGLKRKLMAVIGTLILTLLLYLLYYYAWLIPHLPGANWSLDSYMAALEKGPAVDPGFYSSITTARKAEKQWNNQFVRLGKMKWYASIGARVVTVPFVGIRCTYTYQAKFSHGTALVMVDAVPCTGGRWCVSSVSFQ